MKIFTESCGVMIVLYGPVSEDKFERLIPVVIFINVLEESFIFQLRIDVVVKQFTIYAYKLSVGHQSATAMVERNKESSRFCRSDVSNAS